MYNLGGALWNVMGLPVASRLLAWPDASFPILHVQEMIWSQFAWVGSVLHHTMHVNGGIGSSWTLCVLSRDNQGKELPVKGMVGTLFMSHRSLLQRTLLR